MYSLHYKDKILPNPRKKEPRWDCNFRLIHPSVCISVLPTQVGKHLQLQQESHIPLESFQVAVAFWFVLLVCFGDLLGGRVSVSSLIMQV